MKHLLLTLSSISTLSLSSNVSSFLLTNDNKNTNGIINKSNINNNQSLFSNYYGVFNNTSWWITNQSTSDQKYYSYDLSHANYQLPNSHKYAYIFFIVDSKGLLQYTNEQKQLSTDDQNYLANTKTQIENTKILTNININKSVYSTISYYNNSYFEHPYNEWQFLRLGGLEKHIDISSQNNGDKVEHYQDLSESSGLYSIANAVIHQKIDEAVADNLAQYFISQSSLKDSEISDNLIKQIIRLIIHNSDIYNLILNMPFTNSDKNASLNLIFDYQNNLIAIYYQKWEGDSNFNELLEVTSNNSNFSYMNLNINIQTLEQLKINVLSINDFLKNLNYYNLDGSSMDRNSQWFSDLQINLKEIINTNLDTLINNSSQIGVVIKLQNYSSVTEDSFSYLDSVGYFNYKSVSGDTIEKWYKFCAHDILKTGISQETWKYITNNIGTRTSLLVALLNLFSKDDHSGAGGSITIGDIRTLSNIIIKHYNDLNNKFATSNTGWKVVTNTEGDWEGFESE